MCRLWNREILARQHLDIIVHDSQENFDFIKKVTFLKSLFVRNLRLRKYDELISSVSKANKQLELCLDFLPRTRPCLNIKKLADNWTFLTTLIINRPILVTCDLARYSGLIKPRSIFPNLRTLEINHSEDYEMRCHGKEVQQLSKNVVVLLESLSTQVLQDFCLLLNAEFCDINQCIGREQYKFEESILPEFISRQRNLQRLFTATPLSLSSEHQEWQVFPSNLTDLIVENSVGIEGITNNEDEYQVVRRRDLLQYNRFAIEVLRFEEEQRYIFWRSLIMAQKKLKLLIYRHQDYSGRAEDFFSAVTSTNFRTLVRIYIGTTLTGTIDGRLFANCNCLVELDLYNCLYQPLVANELGDLVFININSLPQSVEKLMLCNVAIDYPEFLAFRNLTSLRKLQIEYEVHHYIKVQVLPYFLEIIVELIENCNLDELTFGKLEFESNEYKYGLDQWYQSDHQVISIKFDLDDWGNWREIEQQKEMDMEMA